MTAKFIIVGWKQVVVIHDFHQVSRSFGSHFSLVVIQLAHFFVENFPSFHDGFHVDHIIQVSFYTRNFTDQRLDSLIPENSSDTSAASLF